MTVQPRWDIDTRGIGVASAARQRPAVERLAEHMAGDGWVAEDADAHLLPHLLAATRTDSSPLRITAHRVLDDGTLELDCASTTGRDRGHQFRDAVALLAVIAESSFHVRRADEATIECVTGMLEGDSEFATHGHVIRLRLAGAERAGEPVSEAVPEAAEGT